MSDRALEEKIFKQRFNPFPLVRYSERPDIVAAHLLKGNIAIIVDTSSSVIIITSILRSLFLRKHLFFKQKF